MGKLVATRLVLGAALDRLSIEQLRDLYDLESASLDGLIQLRSSRGALSELQTEILNEQKRIVFHIGQRIHALETGDPETGSTSEGPAFLLHPVQYARSVFGSGNGVSNVRKC